MKGYLILKILQNPINPNSDQYAFFYLKNLLKTAINAMPFSLIFAHLKINELI